MSFTLIQSLLLNPFCFLWIGCVIVVLALGKRLSRPSFKLRKLLKSENGAAYSLSLALLTPLYTLMICFLIELTLMLNVQIGVDYAAYSAARSAIVWLPAEVTPFNKQQQLIHMVHLAAAQALTPYASSLDKHRRSNGMVDPTGGQNYDNAYNWAVTTGKHQQANYVQSKWQYAVAATRVEFDPPLPEIFGSLSSEAVTVKVTVYYEMPFNTPGVGMILGRKSSSGIGYVRELKSTVTLQLERPKTENGSLGFEYDSRPVGGIAAAHSGAGERHYSCDEVRLILEDIIAKTIVESFFDHVGLGDYDFKTKEPNATFDVFGKTMTSAEFGNFIAGFAGQVNGWQFGADGVRIGGVLYDAADSFVYWIGEKLGFKPRLPNGIDKPSFDFDRDSWPAIEAGVGLAKQFDRDGELPRCGSE